MNITSAQYILNETKDGNGTVIKATIDGTEMQVPLDPANRHYAALLEWAAKDGNTIEEAD
jgi:hypothetical protein